MFCPNCGKEIINNEQFCPQCGKALNSNTPNVQEKTNESNNSKTPVGFILGLVSIIAWFLPIAGYPVTICGIVFSSKSLKSTNKSEHKLAVIGLTLSIIFLIVTLINSVLGVILYNNLLN